MTGTDVARLPPRELAWAALQVGGTPNPDPGGILGVGGRTAPVGATRSHVSAQFLTESALLAAVGALLGLALGAGAGAGAVYALGQHEPYVLPTYALIVAPVAGFAIGALAGLYPAAKAARLSPTEAPRG